MSRDGGIIIAELLKSVATPSYPHVAPQEARLPYILYRMSGGEFPRGLNGDGEISQQLANVEIYGVTREEAATIEGQVSAALRNKRGTIAGVFVHSVFEEPANYDYRVVSERDGAGGFWHVTAYTYRLTFDTGN